ncbi:MAG: glyoxalase [Leptolyngbyaceae cyanobacterium SM1_1_3]|nr:glyoxalase [Leptolyngbyaceae cyanobacterium SM1_1_3]NJN02361.1 glyoxalase [Leptolyngbyaceae cyanobacterium RM1_1_2]NJO10395.1 glyoxalase [Leptolyngbyaceae cyanobacterium SL_1_1]
MTSALFHLAFPVSDIAKTKEFYASGLGCEVGREAPGSVILNLAGNQLTAHVVCQPVEPQRGIYPRHFGLVFRQEADWEALLSKAQSKNLTFYQPPKRRFMGTPLEHRTFFLEDPFHNLLEFKFYCHESAIFGEVSCAQVGDA